MGIQHKYMYMPPIDIHVSHTLHYVGMGSITGLVSENVEEYIIKNGLYKD